MDPLHWFSFPINQNYWSCTGLISDSAHEIVTVLQRDWVVDFQFDATAKLLMQNQRKKKEVTVFKTLDSLESLCFLIKSQNETRRRVWPSDRVKNYAKPAEMTQFVGFWNEMQTVSFQEGICLIWPSTLQHWDRSLHDFLCLPTLTKGLLKGLHRSCAWTSFISQKNLDLSQTNKTTVGQSGNEVCQWQAQQRFGVTRSCSVRHEFKAQKTHEFN